MKEIKMGGETIVLDENALNFNEANLNNFLQYYAGKYNYYASKHAEAQYIHSRLEDAYDALKARKFKTFKEEGGSDKLCEAKVDCDPEVIESLGKVRVSKHNVDLLWGYLRAMDRSHQNCLQTCYNLRKEMDKLYPTFVKTSNHD